MGHNNFAFPKLLDPVTLNEEKMETVSNIVDSDKFNLPPLDGMIELQLRCQEVLPVPIIFSMECGHSVDWDCWVDRDLQDIEFVNLLKRSQIYGSVLVSRGLNMKKKTLPGCDVWFIGGTQQPTHSFLLGVRLL